MSLLEMFIRTAIGALTIIIISGLMVLSVQLFAKTFFKHPVMEMSTIQAVPAEHFWEVAPTSSEESILIMADGSINREIIKVTKDREVTISCPDGEILSGEITCRDKGRKYLDHSGMTFCADASLTYAKLKCKKEASK